MTAVGVKFSGSFAVGLGARAARRRGRRGQRGRLPQRLVEKTRGTCFRVITCPPKICQSLGTATSHISVPREITARREQLHEMPTRRRARAATSPEERVPSCSSSPKSPLAQKSYLEPALPSLPPAEMATEEAVEQVCRLHAAVARLHALGTKLEAENRRCLYSPSLSAGLSAVSTP